jgi:hypothetical protein
MWRYAQRRQPGVSCCPNANPQDPPGLPCMHLPTYTYKHIYTHMHALIARSRMERDLGVDAVTDGPRRGK